MGYARMATAARCLVCRRSVPPGTLACGSNCAAAWRVLEALRSQETPHPLPVPLSLALLRLARGEAVLVRP